MTSQIRGILSAYGASPEEIQAGSLRRQQRQPIDWTLVEKLTAVGCGRAEVAHVLGMSEITLIRAIKLWPEHKHLFSPNRGALQ